MLVVLCSVRSAPPRPTFMVAVVAACPKRLVDLMALCVAIHARRAAETRSSMRPLLPALLHAEWWHTLVMRADALFYLICAGRVGPHTCAVSAARASSAPTR